MDQDPGGRPIEAEARRALGVRNRSDPRTQSKSFASASRTASGITDMCP